jgi:hypothetical protein
MNDRKASACPFVANIFAPIRGGSATIYETLAKVGVPGQMAVLTDWRRYGTGEDIQGGDQRDADARYLVARLELLRRRVMPPPATKLVSVWLYFVTDIPIALRLAVSARRLVRRHGIEVACIGKLASGAWISEFLRRVAGIRLVFHSHGEEITTRHARGTFAAGLVVDSNQPGDIAEALVRLLTDHTLRRRLEQAGLEHARHNDWAARTRIFHEMWAQLREVQA